MTTVSIPKTTQAPTVDPEYDAAVERVRTAVRQLQDRRIIDVHGRRIRQDLPPDMQAGADRDFGG
jgi:hypothetical protein